MGTKIVFGKVSAANERFDGAQNETVSRSERHSNGFLLRICSSVMNAEEERRRSMSTAKANNRSIENRRTENAVDSRRNFEALVLTTFEETGVQLFELSGKIVNTFWSLNGIINRYSYSVPKEREGAERNRQWQLAELKELSREMHEQIGAVAEVKFELLDAIERLKKLRT